MPYRTLIAAAACALPDGLRQANVLLEGDRILAVDPPLTARVDERIDAAGKFLLPGVIDDQVHFREPGLTHKEDLYSASRACAKGGVTTYLEMPNTRPTTTTHAALEAKLALAASKSLVNYGFYVGATSGNIDFLRTVTRSPGIKIFIGSSTGDLLVDNQEVLERIFAETTLPITAHCEDEATIRANRDRIGPTSDLRDHSRIRDHQAAIVCTRRAIDLATRHRHQFHVLHVSTAQEAAFLRDRPAWVTAEACPHHLFFNVDDYARLGTRIQMNPSIKTEADNAALWQALLEGTIEVIATDHAPHTLEEKAQPYPASPSGLPAVENSLALMLNEVNQNRCTLEQVVNWMSTAPARVWHIANKGTIAEGNDADLVLVDMNVRHTIRDAEQLTKCRWSPWDGVTLQGWPVMTWVMGNIVYRDGHVRDEVRGEEVRFAR